MARSLQPVFRHAVLTRLFDYRRIIGIKEDIKLRLIQILDVFGRCRFLDAVGIIERSEEHTSELQSLMRISYAVFCLKKNNNSVTCQCVHTYQFTTNSLTTRCLA